MLDDLLLAYHDLKDLYDDDVDSIESMDCTSGSSSSSSSNSTPIKKQKCSSDHHRIHLQRQQPPEKWRDDDNDDHDDNYKNNDDDDDDDEGDDDNDNDDKNDDEWKPASSDNKVSIKKKKKMSSSSMTTMTTKKRRRHHNDDNNKVKIKTGEGGSSSRSSKRLDNATLKNLMIGLESPSLFSPRAIMLKNEAFLDSLIDDDVDVSDEKLPTPQQTPSSSPDITTVVEKTHNNDGGDDHDDDLEEEDELMAGKRIEVQWDMNDGTTNWYTGTIQSISNGRSEAVLLYDDGDCCLVDMNDDDMEWRTPVVVAPAAPASTAAADDKTETETAPRESSIHSPSTGISGMVVSSSPIVVKKKKKKKKKKDKEKQPSSSSSSSSLPLRDTTMTVILNNEQKPKEKQKQKQDHHHHQQQQKQKQKQEQGIPPLESKQVRNDTTLAVVVVKKKRKRSQSAFAPTAGRRPLPPPIKVPKAKGIAYLTFDRPLVENEEMML
jgi:hypothetical protein